MIASGKSTAAIGGELHLSIKTVSTHKSNILKKLQLCSQAAPIRYAIEHKMELQRWEYETGSTLPRAVENPLF